jgi:hypothetical protein
MAAFVPEPWRKTILGLSMVILMMFVVLILGLKNRALVAARSDSPRVRYR